MDDPPRSLARAAWRAALPTRFALPLVVLVTGLLVLSGSGSPVLAQGRELIHRYDVDISIEETGSILVREVIEYDFGASERHGILRDIPVRLRHDDTYDRLYPLDVLSVSASAGTPDRYELEDPGSGMLRIRIGDPDRTITGRHTYEILYRVEGALTGFDEHDELYWNAVALEWPVGIEQATARVGAPAALADVACFAGPEFSSLPCDEANIREGEAVFLQRALSAYEGLTVVVAIPKGVVPEPTAILEERWSPSRAFSATPLSLGLTGSLLVLVLVGMGRLTWTRGRDRRYVGSFVDVVHGSASGEVEAVPLLGREVIPPEFSAPEDLRPGQVGTLLDEQVNPLDVSATIVDLAVRGYLRIEEIPKKGWFGKPDWELFRLPKDAAGDLLEYEQVLLEGLFEDQGDEVKLSELKTKFVDRLARVQDALYADAVKRGWFPARPDKVRRFWGLVGTGVLVVGVGLVVAAARWTRLGLVPIPLVLGGLFLLLGSRWMPRRTARGTGVLRRVLGFRHVIRTADTNLARFAERENLFYGYLPYAVVFGCTDKWARAFEALGEAPPPPTWYASGRPFAMADFNDALDGFTVATSGTIASRPASSGSSGFGGGGFSGGGGGGGGGGSW